MISYPPRAAASPQMKDLEKTQEEVKNKQGPTAVLLDGAMLLLGCALPAAVWQALSACSTANVMLSLVLSACAAVCVVLANKRFVCGPRSIWQRVLLIALLGVFVPLNASSSISSSAYCWLAYAPVWHCMRRHRLVLVHAGTAAMGAPLKWHMQEGRPAGLCWYLLGVPVCCMTAALSDVAAAGCSSDPSLSSCVLAGTWGLLTGGPASMFSRAAAAAAAESSRLLPYALQACLPALLGACIEHVSAQHQAAAEGTTEPAAAVDSNTTVAEGAMSAPVAAASYTAAIADARMLLGDKHAMPALEQALQQHQQQDAQPKAAPRPPTAINSSSTGSDSSAACGVTASSAAAAAAVAAPAAYVSPLQRNLVAIKLEEPPGTSECCWWLVLPGQWCDCVLLLCWSKCPRFEGRLLVVSAVPATSMPAVQLSHHMLRVCFELSSASGTGQLLWLPC
jgi:hypothetical protein